MGLSLSTPSPAPSLPIAIVDTGHEDIDQLETLENPSQDPKRYKYKELPEETPSIRLLKLKNGESTLECCIKTFNLGSDQCPKFTALSYTWNPSKFDKLIIGNERIPISHRIHEENTIRHPLLCDGQRLLITTNLRDFLLCARTLQNIQEQEKDPIWYWVDAVCINQADDLEREHQVKLMERIYSLANDVLLWLGESDGGIEDLLSVTEVLSMLGDIWLETLEFGGSPPARLNKSPLPPSAHWKSFAEFLERPAFQRVWILQEYALARKLYIRWGGISVNHEDLEKAVTCIMDKQWGNELVRRFGPRLRILDMIGKGHMQLRAHRQSFDDQDQLEGYLMFARHYFQIARMFKSTDPRDKIYGILGLLVYRRYPANSSYQNLTNSSLGRTVTLSTGVKVLCAVKNDTPFLRPDYSKGVIEVYTLATRQVIEEDRSLAVLSYVEDKTIRKLENLPSWVPDWSVCPSDHGRSTPYDQANGCWAPYNASSLLPAEHRCSNKGEEVLSVRGKIVDTITVVDNHTSLKNSNDIGSLSGALLAFGDPCISRYQAISGDSPDKRYDFLWRTLIGDVQVSLSPAGRKYPAPEILRDVFLSACGRKNLDYSLSPADVVAIGLGLAPITPHAWSPAVTRDFDSSIALHMDGRKLFRTKLGFFGAGPMNTSAGQEVYIFDGGPTPYIVEVDPSDSTYQRFIGECYVQGFMNSDKEFQDEKLEVWKSVEENIHLK